ncbi:MAG: elongation factor P [Proteobacteria bacterium]|nr:elongation factor P [Pseudomonadota bacterium]
MTINANDIRVGHILEHEGRLWKVLKTMHTQPGKGGAYMQVEMKDVRDGTKLNVRFRSSETVEKAHLDLRDCQFLYEDGEHLQVMDQESYEQMIISKDLIGEQLPFLQENMVIGIEFYEQEPVTVQLPETVVCTIAECEPVVKGQTAASSYKPAILDNKVRVMVPPFINVGDRVIVRVTDRQYIERAKD